MPENNWDKLLDADESILWQGRPDGGFVFIPHNKTTFIFGFIFIFLGGLLLLASGGDVFTDTADDRHPFNLPFNFLYIHIAVGLVMVFGETSWNTYKRRSSWYTLTNKRALVATKMLLSGQRLKSFPITPETKMDFQDGPLASIWLSQEKINIGNSPFIVRHGFERITDGRDVYALMRKVQVGEA